MQYDFNSVRKIIDSLPIAGSAKEELYSKLREVVGSKDPMEIDKFVDGLHVLEGWLKWASIEDKLITIHQNYEELLKKEKEAILQYIKENKDKHDQEKLEHMRQLLNDIDN